MSNFRDVISMKKLDYRMVHLVCQKISEAFMHLDELVNNEAMWFEIRCLNVRSFLGG